MDKCRVKEITVQWTLKTQGDEGIGRGVGWAVVLDEVLCKKKSREGTHRAAGPSQRPQETRLSTVFEEALVLKKLRAAFLPRSSRPPG